jgi:hypothetical protein
VAIGELKPQLGCCDYQPTTTIACHRLVPFCCGALSIGRFILCSTASLPWVTDSSTTVNESRLSFPKRRRCLRQSVIKRLQCDKSAPEADFEKSDETLEAILRLAAESIIGKNDPWCRIKRS